MNPYLKTVDGILFSKDGTILYAYPAGKPDTIYIIPDTVTKIHAGAFLDSRLTSITIPKSVTDIDYYFMNVVRQSFRGSLNYLGTIEEWGKITFSDSIQDSWHTADRVTVHCLDGDIVIYTFDDRG